MPFSVSVTALADFCCRTGDLLPAGIAGPTAREGIRVHRKLQRESKERAEQNNVPLESEVSLVCCSHIDGNDISLRGRVDLVDYSIPRLSEIKTSYVLAEHVPESQRALHWAQLYLYGFLYLSQHNDITDCLELELLHVNIRAENQESECRRLSKVALNEFAEDSLRRYLSWLKQVSAWREQMVKSAHAMNFPHANFRSGQRDMAVAVYRSARDGGVLMCEAPTGIGKTVSALFPGIKSLGEGAIEQLSYLTAKVAGRLSALQAIASMQSAGLAISAIQIRAKQPTCFCSNGRCERDDVGRCPMTVGFFDRLPAAREELLACGLVTDERVDDIAWQHQLCPFELTLQLLPWVHIVIADYNYVFDPLVRLPHYAESRSDSLLLIDEAHNLVNRSRSMYSAELSRSGCMEQALSCRQSHPMVARALDALARQLLNHAVGQASDVSVREELCKPVSRSASQLIEAMAATLGQSPMLPDGCQELFRTLCRFVAIAELFGEQHRCLTAVAMSGKRKEVFVQLFCLDASLFLAKQYRQFRSSVVFSATLRPPLFYRDALGLPDDSTLMQLPSPFDPLRSCHCIVNWIDTRYRRRESSLPALVELIHEASVLKPGNYLVFFPSYAYLNQAWEMFSKCYPGTETWKQSSAQSREDQHQLLNHLDQAGHRIGFAILGGVFGEGIDYAGNRLIGVIVVSPALPSLDTQTRLMSEYYQAQGHDGYNFAYRYPGFTRVLQTVGRLVRGEQDSGIVLLVDSRFGQFFYKTLFPTHWNIHESINKEECLVNLKRFWASLS